ncbi:hypothetical protein N431DRAFT_444341 [Stipitochalara longipes BDJ]|nr:hypothetical protein N431DRAFT_444341 [Stipitochalara longipes BDJ]
MYPSKSFALCLFSALTFTSALAMPGAVSENTSSNLIGKRNDDAVYSGFCVIHVTGVNAGACVFNMNGGTYQCACDPGTPCHATSDLCVYSTSAGSVEDSMLEPGEDLILVLVEGYMRDRLRNKLGGDWLHENNDLVGWAELGEST